MPMFRPHILRVIHFVPGGMDDEGRPLPDTETYEDIECRIVPMTTGQKVIYADGKSYSASFVVYLDRDCREFDRGERVRLFGRDGEIRDSQGFEVKFFHRYSMDAKLWV